jgi:DNA mismatch repair ATPase MutL
MINMYKNIYFTPGKAHCLVSRRKIATNSRTGFERSCELLCRYTIAPFASRFQLYITTKISRKVSGLDYTVSQLDHRHD